MQDELRARRVRNQRVCGESPEGHQFGPITDGIKCERCKLEVGSKKPVEKTGSWPP